MPGKRRLGDPTGSTYSSLKCQEFRITLSYSPIFFYVPPQYKTMSMYHT